MMKHNVLKLSILLIVIVSLLCSCSFNKPDGGDNNGAGNIEIPDSGNTGAGDNNNQPENPDNNTPENPDSGNESGGNNKPTEPDPDAGKNGICYRAQTFNGS